MAKKVIWSKQAEKELAELLRYWAKRNGSNVYSNKLLDKIKSELRLLAMLPHLGRLTDVVNVRAKIVSKYLIFYRVRENSILIIAIRHTSRNPNNYQ